MLIIRESAADKPEFVILPDARVIIMVFSADFLLQDVIKKLTSTNGHNKAKDYGRSEFVH